MSELIDSLLGKISAALTEIRRLGLTLNQWAADVLAYFDGPGTSTGLTEAINGRLENLRELALGFRNLTNYITRSLLEAGGFGPHPPSVVKIFYTGAGSLSLRCSVGGCCDVTRRLAD